MNLVLVPEVPLLEASRDGDLAEDRLEEDEALHDVVHVGEPRSGGQDDALGFVVSIHTPPAYLFRGVLVVLEEGGEGGGLVDDILRPREVAKAMFSPVGLTMPALVAVQKKVISSETSM